MPDRLRVAFLAVQIGIQRMSVTPIEPERLQARKIPFRNRLWVRVISISLLVTAISIAGLWWPRRTMLAVWFVNGQVFCESHRKPTYDLMVNLGILQTVWGTKNFSNHYALLSGTGCDRDVNVVVLQDSKVKDDWLIQLKDLPSLKYVGLHDRQLGAGIEVLNRISTLKHLGVTAVGDRHLAELRRLPHLEQVSLWSPRTGDIGLDSLPSLPRLKSLLIDGSRQTDQILKSLPEISTIEELVVQNCTGFADDDLAHLRRFPNLKYLDLVRCGPINDKGLKHLCQLNHLETLAIRKSSGRFTNEGLESLKELPHLKEIIVLQGDFTAEQIQ